MTIIIFIIVLAVIILVHEFGHFLLAKLFGVRVEEFGIGLPPRIWGKKIGETIYSINWIPLGGFVRMFGEDPSETDLQVGETENPRSFFYKPKWKQALILIAGISFNLIFAWFVISFGFAIGMPAPVGASVFGETQNVQTVVTSVLPKSPAETAGLIAGDTIISVDVGGKPVANPTAENISQTISQSKTGDVTISYKQGDDAPKTVTITPNTSIVPGERLIGISMDGLGTLKLSPPLALLEGAHTTYLLIISTAQGLGIFLWQTVMGKSNWSDVSGPIGIATVVGQATRLGFVYLLSLVALISLNLALINLVPFPALDGGRLLFVAIEAVTRRQIPPKVASWLNTIGFFLLLALMLFISAHDVFNLIK
jgi:regulator of sigma E protease